MTSKTFSETQKFTQWWLWVILVIVFGITVFSMIMVLYVEKETTVSKWVLVIPVLVIAGIGVLFTQLRLITKINSEYVFLKYKPFLSKKVSWGEIASIEVLNYGFVGGWGIRLWTSYGTVYNVKGNKGLAIQLKSGKKFLIGTQKPEELQKFLELLPQAQTVLKS